MVLRMSEDLSREHEEEQRTQYFRTRMQLALEASDIAIWERQLDQDQGYWSDRFKAILGLPADFTPSNKAFMKRVHKDDHQNLANTIEAVSENGEPFSIRVRLQLDNGKLRWVTIRGHRIVDSEKGNKIIGTMVDDTELVTRMERLGTLNSQMELGEKLSQTGYWQVDLESQTLIWSDQVYRIHGLDPLSYKTDSKGFRRCDNETARLPVQRAHTPCQRRISTRQVSRCCSARRHLWR